MTCSANKKSHTLYGAWLACRSHATIQVHLGHILDISWTNNAGSDKVLCLSPPETLSAYRRAVSAIRQDGAVRTHLIYIFSCQVLLNNSGWFLRNAITSLGSYVTSLSPSCLPLGKSEYLCAHLCMVLASTW